MDDARDGRADVQPVDLFGQAAPPFGEFQFAVAEVAQLGIGLFPPCAAPVQDLDVYLGHLALGLRAGGVELPRDAIESRLFTLQRKDPPRLGQPPVKKRFQVLQLLPDQRQLVGGRPALRPDPLDLVDDLRPALAQLVDLVRGGFLPRGEKFLLPRHQGRDLRAAARGLGQFGGEGQVVGVVAFRLKPAPPGEDFEELPLDDGQLRLQQRAVQLDQRIACRDKVAVLDEDGFHHAAIGVLHDLPVLLHLHPAGGDDGTGDLRRRGPKAKTADQQQKREQPEQDRAARRGAKGFVGFAHTTPPCPVERTISGALRTMAFSTSSRGPKARRAPLSRTRSRSHS